jgi:hypothetical protein
MNYEHWMCHGTERNLQMGDSATEDAAEVVGGESHHH